MLAPPAVAPHSPPWLREGHSEPAVNAREGPLTLPHSPPPPTPLVLTSPSTSTTIPPVAIFKPRGLLVRGVPPGGAAGLPNYLTLNHASYHQLTCPMVHWRSWTPAVYHHGLRSCHQSPTMAPSILSATSSSPRCWSHLGVSLDTRTGVPPWCRRQGGAWTVGPHNHPSPSATPPSLPHQPHRHNPRIHDSWPLPWRTKLCSIVVSTNSI